MIQRVSVSLCLLTGLVWGQALPSAPQPTTPQPPANPPSLLSRTEVPADTPVITIQGVCDHPGAEKNPADCKTVVTRAEFEEVTSALQPNMPPQARRQFAGRYATGLKISEDAHQAGIDQTPRFAELMKIMRLQVSVQLLLESVQQKAGQVSDQDLQDYYQSHSADYQQADMQQLYIPHNKRTVPAAPAPGQPSAAAKPAQDSAASMEKEAQSLRARAAAGEDFTKLEEEAYAAAAMTSKPLNTNMEKVRKSTLPPAHVSVLELKTGEVSQVFSDPSGYYVYKMGRKDPIPFDTVKPEILNTLRTQRAQTAMKQIQDPSGISYNDDYFGPAPAPNPGGMQVRPSGASSAPKAPSPGSK